MRRKSNKMKKEILFGDFVFKLGLNVTVRRGVKWYGARGNFIAKPTDKNDKREIPITILNTEFYKFLDLPAAVISNEHIQRCANWRILWDEMIKAYGPDFNIDEYVTAISFKLGDK